VDARERWQTLQSRLTAARAALEAGDRDRALSEVDGALAIDASFLAAAALRERILGSEVAGFGFRVQNPENPENPKNPQNPENPQNPQNPLPATRNPLPDRYVQFEQRARRRRLGRRILAAKQAIARRNLFGAAAALDEVIELDPDLPELSELTAAFDELRRALATSHRGPTIAAAVAFVAVTFGVSGLHEGSVLGSLPSSAIATLSTRARRSHSTCPKTRRPTHPRSRATL